jgi:hypothetical protein
MSTYLFRIVRVVISSIFRENDVSVYRPRNLLADEDGTDATHHRTIFREFYKDFLNRRLLDVWLTYLTIKTFVPVAVRC